MGTTLKSAIASSMFSLAINKRMSCLICGVMIRGAWVGWLSRREGDTKEEGDGLGGDVGDEIKAFGEEKERGRERMRQNDIQTDRDSVEVRETERERESIE